MTQHINAAAQICSETMQTNVYKSTRVIIPQCETVGHYYGDIYNEDINELDILLHTGTNIVVPTVHTHKPQSPLHTVHTHTQAYIHTHTFLHHLQGPGRYLTITLCPTSTDVSTLNSRGTLEPSQYIWKFCSLSIVLSTLTNSSPTLLEPSAGNILSSWSGNAALWCVCEWVYACECLLSSKRTFGKQFPSHS